MKKISYFVIALALTAFTACKEKNAGDGDDTDMDTLSVQVENGASESIENKEKTNDVLEQSNEDELLGTDLDDAEVEAATKK